MLCFKKKNVLWPIRYFGIMVGTVQYRYPHLFYCRVILAWCCSITLCVNRRSKDTKCMHAWLDVNAQIVGVDGKMNG